MRVAVDEARDRAEPAAVQLDDVAVERAEIAHRPDRFDRLAVAEDVAVLDEVDLAERLPAQRRFAPRRADDLTQVADEQPRHDQTLGRSRPCSRAASSASS